MTEIYKTKCGLNPPFMKEIFTQLNISYSLRHGDDAQLPKVRTTSIGVKSITLEMNCGSIYHKEKKTQAAILLSKQKLGVGNGENATVHFAWQSM